MIMWGLMDRSIIQQTLSSSHTEFGLRAACIIDPGRSVGHTVVSIKLDVNSVYKYKLHLPNVCQLVLSMIVLPAIYVRVEMRIHIHCI